MNLPALLVTCYSARLAVTEYLDTIRRQAGAIMLREINPGYIMPVGVWNVRQSLRALIKRKFEPFDSMDTAMNYVSTIFEIPKSGWIENSAMLQKAYFQRKISEFNYRQSGAPAPSVQVPHQLLWNNSKI